MKRGREYFAFCIRGSVRGKGQPAASGKKKGEGDW